MSKFNVKNSGFYEFYNYRFRKIINSKLLLGLLFFVIIIWSLCSKSFAAAHDISTEDAQRVLAGANLTYEMFGAVGDGTTNDADAIEKAHKWVNDRLAEGKKITVYGTAGKNYYIRSK